MPLQKYRSLFYLTLVQEIKNYKVLVGLGIFLVTCLVIFSHLWKVAAVKGSSTFDPVLLLWYIAFNEWVLIAVPELHREMQEDLQTGRLAYMLPRPISYLGATFSKGLATLILQLVVLGVIAFLFTFAWTGAFPFSAVQFALMLAIGLLAGIVGLVLQMLIGLSSFWIHDVTPVNWVWEKFLFIFGGLLLPLSAYPVWLEKLAAYTPYAPILGARSALVFGCDMSLVLSIVGALFFWLMIGVVALQIMYKRGLKILNIHGG